MLHCRGLGALRQLKTGRGEGAAEGAVPWTCKMRLLITVIKEGVMLLVNTSVQATSS